MKELLNWIMSEADSFSKDVTTRGDKGVADHVITCKVLPPQCARDQVWGSIFLLPVQNFMTTLEGKGETIGKITKQATALKEKDGEKKNGTSDVESRCVCVCACMCVCMCACMCVCVCAEVFNMPGRSEFWLDKWEKWSEIGQWPAAPFQLRGCVRVNSFKVGNDLRTYIRTSVAASYRQYMIVYIIPPKME